MKMVTAWIKANIATKDDGRNLADALDVLVLNATIDAAIAKHDARRPRT
jgi:pseudouridine-5'-phosphate glycosidase